MEPISLRRPRKSSRSHSLGNFKLKAKIEKNQASDFSTLEKVVKYLKANHKRLQRPLSQYSTQDLMMKLDHEKLASLEDEFKKFENGLELPNFIWLLQCAIEHPIEDQYELVRGLINLFEDIDINNDKNVEWSEFTQYIIDAVIKHKEAIEKESKQSKKKVESEENRIKDAYSKGTRQYILDERVGVNLKIFQDYVQKIRYSRATKHIFLLEEGYKTVRVYNTSTVLVTKIGMPPNKRNNKQKGKKESNFVLDFDISQEEQLVALLSSEREVVIYRLKKLNEILYFKRYDSWFDKIYWSPILNLWILSDLKFTLTGLKFDEKPKKHFAEKFSFTAHRDKITGLVVIEKLKLMATISFDGSMKFWDTRDFRLKKDVSIPLRITDTLASKYLALNPVLKTRKKGFAGLEYSSLQSHFMVSWGFSYNVAIWNPYFSLNNPYCGSYSGHNNVINTCKILSKSPTCLSLDARNNIRIWDLRSLETIQVMPMESIVSSLTEMYVFQNDNFLICGRAFHFAFNSEAKDKIELLEQAYPIKAEYDDYSKSFVVITNQDVRIHSTKGGRLDKVFTSLLAKNRMVMPRINQFVMGPRHRKFYMGDNLGIVRLYNLSNAEFIKEVNNVKYEAKEISEYQRKLGFVSSKPKKFEMSSVTCMLHIELDSVMVVGTSNSVIKFFDLNKESAEESFYKFFFGGHKKAAITALSYNRSVGILASGSANGVITLWDVANGKLEYSFLAHSKEIVGLSFGFPYPVVIAASKDGSLSIWGHRPIEYKLKNRCIYRLLNFWYKGDENDQRADQIVPFTSFHSFMEVGKLRFPLEVKNQLLRDMVKRSTRVEEYDTFLYSNGLKTKNSNLLGGKRNRSPRKSFRGRESHYCFVGELECKSLKDVIKELSNTPETVKTEPQKISKQEFVEINQKQLLDRYETNEHIYVYLGDAKGSVMVLDLAKHLDFQKINKIRIAQKDYKEDKIHRSENLNSTSVVDSMISTQRTGLMYISEIYDIRLSCMNYARHNAHIGEVTSITHSKKESILMSTGKDKMIKIWKLSGPLLSQISMSKPELTSWNFQIDVIKNLEIDFKKVFKNLELIEGRDYPEEQKRQIFKNFLYKNYVLPDLNEKMKKVMPDKSQLTLEYYNRFLESITNALKKTDEHYGLDKFSKLRSTSATAGSPILAKELKTALPKLKNYQLYDVDTRDYKITTACGHMINKQLEDIDSMVQSQINKKLYSESENMEKRLNKANKLKEVNYRFNKHSKKGMIQSALSRETGSMNQKKVLKAHRLMRSSASVPKNLRSVKMKKSILKPASLEDSGSRLPKNIIELKKKNEGVTREPLIKGIRRRKAFKGSAFAIPIKQTFSLTTIKDNTNRLEGTDIFIDDFSKFKKKTSVKPEIRIKKKKQDEMPRYMVDSAIETQQSYQKFMSGLVDSYKRIGNRYQVVSKRFSSRLIKRSDSKDRGLGAHETSGQEGGRGSLYSRIKRRKALFKNYVD